MSNPWFSEFPERSATAKGAMPPPKLRTGQPATSMTPKAFQWPSLKGKPRKVFKPGVKRIKTHVHEEY